MVPPKVTWNEENLSKKVDLVFEVIIQPPKHTFEIGFFFHVLAHCAVALYDYVVRTSV